MFVDRRIGRSSAYQGAVAPSLKSPAEPVYGVVLLDRFGRLLGASTSAHLPGEVEVPFGVDIRSRDLSSDIAVDQSYMGGRRFALASAAWVVVKSKRVRVGIYLEPGDRHTVPDPVELDLGAISAILSVQMA
jgi:hypothetical protein